MNESKEQRGVKKEGEIKGEGEGSNGKDQREKRRKGIK